MSFSVKYLILPSFISVWMATDSYAREGCNRHCLEALHARIAALEEKVDQAVPVGTILPYASPVAVPEGYLLCEGQQVNRTDYPLLFRAIHLRFTPEVERTQESTTFRIPDLRGRVPVGSGRGNELTQRVLGRFYGKETHQMSIAQLPSHNHPLVDNGHSHTIEDNGHEHPAKSGAAFLSWRHGGDGELRATYHNVGGFQVNGLGVPMIYSTANAHTNIQVKTATTKVTMENTGGGAPFSLIQPSLGVRYIIKVR